MWWAGSKSVDVFLGVRRVLVAQRGELLHAETVDGADAGNQALESWFSAQKGRWAVRVWLSGSLCRVFIQQPVPRVRASDLKCILEAEASLRTGLAAPCEAWREPGRGMQPHAVAVVESSVLESIWRWRDRCRGRLKLCSVQPWWAEVLGAAQKRQPDCGGLLVDDQESLTIFSGQGHELDAAMSIAPLGSATEASSQRQRALFGLGIDEGEISTVMLEDVTTGQATLGENDGALPMALSAWARQR